MIRSFPLFFALLVFLSGVELAYAQLTWRVSIKFFTDASGNLPANGSVNTLSEAQGQIDFANQALAATGRGYQFELVDNVALPASLSQWFNYDFTEANKATLESTAKANSTYQWRNNAINIYICGTGGTNSGGKCSFPNTGQEIIIVAQNSFSDVIIHESGHFFSLRHTHEGEAYQNQNGSACSASDCTCAVWVPAQGDSRISDTILDHQCYSSSNQIAIAQYGMSYTSLQPFQQELVLNTWLNIMSYHSPGSLFTDDQVDRMTDSSNDPGQRFNVATGRTRFVATTGSDSSGNGSSTSCYRSVNKGVAVALSGDIVLIHSGNYNETPTIIKPVTLRATRGAATIGRP